MRGSGVFEGSLRRATGRGAQSAQGLLLPPRALARWQVMPYYREDLDPTRFLGPEVAGREPIYFQTQCHLDAPLRAHYREGVLTVECSLCRTTVVAVVVASRGEGRRDFEDEERCP